MGRFIMVSEVNAILPSTATTAIQLWLPYMPGRVCAICNNYFLSDQAYVSGGDYTFSATTSIRTAEDSFTEDGNFAVGDDIYVKGTLRNDGFYILSEVSAVLAKINTNAEYAEQAVVAENVDTEDLRDVYISFVKFPRELKPIVVNMIRYDIFERQYKKGIQSEKVGNYSVSYFRAAGLGYNYPDDIIGGLDMFVIPAVG